MLLRKYDVIFFDWDGTAAPSREETPEALLEAMGRLLKAGVTLAVVSGTDYGNIAGGALAERFAPPLRAGLHFGLARGAYNLMFGQDGRTITLNVLMPGKKTLLALHKACFALHEHLFERHGLATDIIFSRDNYCKIDLLPHKPRGGRNFPLRGELEEAELRLAEYGFWGGMGALLRLAVSMGERGGLALKATCDGKYLELGFGTKADNVDAIFTRLEETRRVTPADCCFWGDEFLPLAEGVPGSDALMLTPKTCGSDFFDVSDTPGPRPAPITHIGGGVGRFLAFLQRQAMQ
jgi:hypothetical protein